MADSFGSGTRARRSRTGRRGLPLCLLFLSPSGAADEAEELLGFWAPRPDLPMTAAVIERVRDDGATCQEEVHREALGAILARQEEETVTRRELKRLKRQRRRGKSVARDAPTGNASSVADPTMETWRLAFGLCMERHGWTQVSPADFNALRLIGTLAECEAGGGDEPCASAINDVLHGVQGSTVALDGTAALLLGRRLCEAGDGDVCLTLSSIYLHGVSYAGIGPRLDLSFQHALSGCEADHAECCGFAGVLLVTPDQAGVEHDVARGSALLAKACALGQATACKWPWVADPPGDASLPAGQAWCRYVAREKTGSNCPDIQVTWVGLPDTEVCRKRIEFVYNGCTVRFDLGR